MYILYICIFSVKFVHPGSGWLRRCSLAVQVTEQRERQHRGELITQLICFFEFPIINRQIQKTEQCERQHWGEILIRIRWMVNTRVRTNSPGFSQPLISLGSRINGLLSKQLAQGQHKFISCKLCRIVLSCKSREWEKGTFDKISHALC